MMGRYSALVRTKEMKQVNIRLEIRLGALILLVVIRVLCLKSYLQCYFSVCIVFFDLMNRT